MTDLTNFDKKITRGLMRGRTHIPKFFIVILLFVLFGLFSFKSNAAVCVYESGNTTIRNDGTTLDNCTDMVILSVAEYTRVMSIAEAEEFDEIAYDVGLYGIVKMFVLGIGIGAILGMLFKLRR